MMTGGLGTLCQVLVNVTNEAGLQTEVKDVGQDGTSPVAYDYDDFGVLFR